MVFHTHLSVPLPLASLLALLLHTKEDQKKQVEEERRFALVFSLKSSWPFQIQYYLEIKPSLGSNYLEPVGGWKCSCLRGLHVGWCWSIDSGGRNKWKCWATGNRWLQEESVSTGRKGMTDLVADKSNVVGDDKGLQKLAVDLR